MKDIKRIVFRVAGMELVADHMNSDIEAPLLVFLHGSGQTRHSWHRAMHDARRRGYRALAVDLRGHGDSSWSPDGVYDFESFCADLQGLVSQLDTPPMLIGASLGGMISLLTVAMQPSLARALVLVDITPRPDVEGALEVVRFMESAPEGFSSPEEAADAVASYLTHREKPRSADGLLRNLRLRNGRYCWHWDPAFLHMGRDKDGHYGPGPAFEDAARALMLPTLLIRGGRSRIVTPESAREFIEMVPQAEYVDIQDAHHMVAGDANDVFNAAIFDFADRVFGGVGRRPT